MTDELTKKLREFLESVGQTYYFEGGEADDEEYADWIQQITQAFIDAGWREPDSVHFWYQGVKYTGPTAINKVINDYVVSTNQMTGQEWYDRFINEFPAWDGFISKEYNDGYADSRMKALEAAKKASGIES